MPSDKKVIVTMPAYKAERTLEKTLHDLPRESIADIILVDDASPDNTAEISRSLGIHTVVHQENRGYGGNQKTCYDTALARGADVVVLLHPDYQYDPKMVTDLVAPILSGEADFTFGSRFRRRWRDPLKGGMPLYRWIGNRVTTFVENLVLGTRFTEMHSGFKAYNRHFLENVPYNSYSDGFVFDSQMLVDAVLAGRFRIREVAIPTRYTEESSSASIYNSIRYVLLTVIYALRGRFRRRLGSRAVPRPEYPSAKVPAPLATAFWRGVRGIRVEGALTWAGLRMLLALAAFYTAYKGELLLEGRLHISRGIVYLVVAAAMLIVAGWRRPVVAAACAKPPPASRSPDLATGPKALARRWVASFPALGWWGLLLAAIGLGFAFRLYQIGSLPFGVWFDEAQNGLVARKILDDSSYRPVFVGGLTQLPALFFYVFAVAVKLIGHGVLALRSVTTAAGILTLFFVYLLARELFDRRVAVLATFLLAVMRWHVNFSRFGMHGIFAPLFMAATFYFLARGLKGKGPWNFFAAGVMAGVGLQGYFSFLLVPFVIVFYLFHHAVFQRTLAWRRLVLGVGVFAVVTAAVYAPVGVWALRNPDQFNQRAETLTITKNRSAGQVAEAVWGSTRKHLLMFNSTGDANGRHNLPGAPMLDTYTGFLFILGVGYALWRWRDPSHFLLLAWVAVTLQGGIWSVEFEAPQAYRTVGLTPAIAMLAALPLGLLWRLATERAEVPEAGLRPGSARFGFWALGGAAGLVTLFTLAQAGRLNFETYFHKQLTAPDAWSAYSTEATFVGKELARLGNDHDIYYSPVFAGQPTVQFLAPDAPPPNPLDAARDLPLGEPAPTVFLLDQNQRPTFNLLKSYYPGGTFVEFRQPKSGTPLVYEAIISAEDVASAQGVTYHYQGQGGSREGRLGVLDLDWGGTPPLSLPFDGEWAGLLKVPRYGSYTLEARAPGPVELYLDGKPVGTGEGAARTSALSLAQGLHDITMRAQVKQAGPVRLLWQSEGSALEPVPAAQLFSAPVRRQGLEGSYFTGAGGGGSHLESVRIDQTPGGYFHFIPVQIPFTIRWRGTIDIPASASYHFLVQAVDEGSLSIDGVSLLTTPGPNRVAEATLELAQGPHDIEITFRQRGGSPVYINVLWVTPQGGPEPIPGELLSPP